jgi:hypothetical protein
MYNAVRGLYFMQDHYFGISILYTLYGGSDGSTGAFKEIPIKKCTDVYIEEGPSKAADHIHVLQ